MKKLSKMMLAAVASVALAAPAFAWDFSASGSASAAFNITTVKANKDANALTGGGVSSDVGAITLSSTHADGANSSTLSYAVDWADSGLDESISISGSRKVGNWTASAGASYNLDRPGCYASDNGSGAAAVGATRGCAQQTGGDTTALTLTDGTMTIVLGDASHLSSQNVGSASNAGGAVGFSGDDDAIGARVGGYNGVSLGYAISDTMSVAVAYQASSDITDACGSGDTGHDSEVAGQHGISGTGFSFNGTFGTIGVGATICNAATESKVSTLSTSTATSTMGVGVSMDFGDIDPWISFGTYSSIGTVSKAGVAYVGTDIGLTYALGSDTVVFSSTSSTEISTAGGTAGEALAKSGMELGYSTAVGPMGLAIGYGSTTNDQKGGVEGYAYSDIEVEMSISF